MNSAKRERFGQELQQLQIPDLYAALDGLLAQIPAGRVSTYGDLADALGTRAATRWVGEYLLSHTHTPECPCHRVVRKSGELGRFITGNVADKRAALRQDGVEVGDDVVDLDCSRFQEFETDRPLAPLIDVQQRLPDFVRFDELGEDPEFVGGVDVSYINSRLAVGALTVTHITGELVDTVTLTRPVRFPYIPGFLSFRESPLLMELLQNVRQLERVPQVVLVDGNGILHPRRAGLATYLGVAMGLRTIGVGKSLLCGSVDLQEMPSEAARPILDGEEHIGMAIKAGDSSRPIFVSPGHRIRVNDAARIARRLFAGHRLPEPLFLADKISRETAKSFEAEHC